MYIFINVWTHEQESSLAQLYMNHIKTHKYKCLFDMKRQTFLIIDMHIYKPISHTDHSQNVCLSCFELRVVLYVTWVYLWWIWTCAEDQLGGVDHLGAFFGQCHISWNFQKCSNNLTPWHWLCFPVWNNPPCWLSVCDPDLTVTWEYIKTDTHVTIL